MQYGFQGRHENTIDDKGRVALPARLRRLVRPEADDTLILTRGQAKHCLILYPKDYWYETMAPKLQALDPFDPDQSRLLRAMMSWTEELRLDGQGRIALPARHLQFAGLSLTSEAVFLGMQHTIEIWSDHHLADDPEDFEDLARQFLSHRLPSPPPADQVAPLAA